MDAPKKTVINKDTFVFFITFLFGAPNNNTIVRRLEQESAEVRFRNEKGKPNQTSFDLFLLLVIRTIGCGS